MDIIAKMGSREVETMIDKLTEQQSKKRKVDQPNSTNKSSSSSNDGNRMYIDLEGEENKERENKENIVTATVRAEIGRVKMQEEMKIQKKLITIEKLEKEGAIEKCTFIKLVYNGEFDERFKMKLRYEKKI